MANPPASSGCACFPNPAFDEAAAKRWDPQRYYNDPSYYLRKDLVRPYRVGMSCGFCHISANPEKPPANPETPQFESLSSTAGAQYFWVDRILAWNADPSNFLFQVLHTARPGSLDTSLVSTDNINNPRTMNAIYNVLPRLDVAKKLGREMLGPDNLANKQFNDFVSSGPLTQFFQPPNTVWTPHVLKDGSDSVGVLGALNRVYLNIGLFSEDWLRHFNPILGGKPVTPIQITTARANSAYWDATELQTPDMALFLLKASYPHKLANAPGGGAYLNDPPAIRATGQGGVCRQLRRLPFEQSAPATGQRRFRQLHRTALSRMLESLLGMDADRRFPQQDASDCRSRRISSTAIICRTTLAYR